MKKRLSYGLYALVLLLVIAAGRATMAVYNTVSVDIAYASWFADLFQYATDVLNGAKIALGYGAMAYCTHYISKKAGSIALAVFIGGLILENAVRFLLDYLSSSTAYYGIPLTLIALGGRLLYEGAFALAAWLIVRLFLKRRAKETDEKRKAVFRAENGARASVLLLMTAQLLGELGYLLDYLSVYGDMTSSEIAACVGSFLYILVMHGGIPLLLCEGAFWFLPKITYPAK